MKYFTDENGVWGKKILDPQVICFEPEIEKALADDYWVFKVQESNSGLRYVLTMVGDGEPGTHCGVSADDKGLYVKTLKMGLLESIAAAKKFIGPNRPIIVDDAKFMKKPTEMYLAFERWINGLGFKSKRQSQSDFDSYRDVITRDM